MRGLDLLRRLAPGGPPAAPAAGVAILCGLLSACGGGREAPTPILPDAGLAVPLDAGAPLALVVSPLALTVREQGPAVGFEVALNRKPPAEVELRIVSSNAAAATLEPAVLRFGRDDGDRPQTVQVTAPGDDDARGGRVTLTLVADGLEPVRVELEIEDDDAVGLIATPALIELDEGGEASLSVRLAARPEAPIEVTLTATAVPGLHLEPARLSIAPEAFDRPMAVRVRADHDDDVEGVAGRILVSAPGLETLALPVLVRDDDVLQLALSSTVVRLREGGAPVSIEVGLSHRPSAPVELRVAVDGAAVRTATSTLRFAPEAWERPQALTLTAVDDDDAEPDRATLRLEAAGLDPRRVEAEVEDDDVQAIVIDTATVALDEGASATLSVRLRHRPRAEVDVTIASDAPAVVSPLPARLRFGPTDWATPQPVQLAAAPDDDVEDGAALIRLEGVGTSTRVRVRVRDDDVQAIVARPARLSVPEDGSASLEVGLAFRPSAPVRLTVSSTSPSVTITPAELSIEPSSWGAPLAVRVFGVQDLDVSPELAAVTVSAPGLASARVVAEVIDDDVQRLVVPTTPVSLDEGGVAAAITVRLAFQPDAPVEVVLVSEAPGSIAVHPTRMVFSPDDWDQPQAAAISAPQDPDTRPVQGAVRIESAGLPVHRVTVTVRDDDVQAVLVDRAQLVLDEGDLDTVSVRLAFEPDGPLPIDVQVTDAGAISVTPARLVLGPGDYASPRVLSVSALADLDLADESASLVLRALGAATATVAVVVRDDDEQAILSDRATLELGEGTLATLSVALAFAPAGPVRLRAASSAPDRLSVAPAELELGPADYATPRPLTLVALDDDDVEDAVVELVLTSSGAPEVRVRVTIRDDDRQAIVLSPPSLSLDEGTTGAGPLVRLAFRPAQPIAVRLASARPSLQVSPASVVLGPADWAQGAVISLTALDDADTRDARIELSASATGLDPVTATVDVRDDDVQAILVSPASLALDEGAEASFELRLAFDPVDPIEVALTVSDPTAVAVTPSVLAFDAGSWSAPRSVRVRALADLDLANESVLVTASAPDANGGAVGVAVRDDDVQALVVDRGSLELREGTSETLRVALAFLPPGPVDVTITSLDPGAVRVTPASLRFDPASFATPQAVTIEALDDADASDEDTVVRVSSPAVATVSVPTRVIDDEVQSLVLDRTALTVGEGASAGFTVRLAFAPPGPVAVDLASDRAAVTVSPTRVTFESSDFDTPRAITVTAASDDDTRDLSASLTVSSAGLSPRSVAVTVADDDVQALVLGATALSLTEGGSGSVGLRLAFDPVDPVDVTIETDRPNVATVTPTTLRFTTADWATPRSLSVDAPHDDDLEDGAATLRASAAGLTPVTVAVAVDDDDTQAWVVDPGLVALTEGGQLALRVSLAFRPSAPMTVAVSSATVAVATVAPTSLGFSTTDWATPKTITVIAPQDDDVAPGVGAIRLSAPAAGLVDRVVPVAVTDDDTLRLVLTTDRLTLTEGGTAGAVGVRLSHRPGVVTTVAISSSDPGAVLPVPSALSFDAQSWSTNQIVEVRIPDDDDVVDESATLTVATTGVPSETVAVTVRDDDSQALIVSPETVGLVEGTTAALGVRLAFDPRGAVSVDLVTPDPGAVTVSPSRLDFPAGTWNQPRSVTLSAVSDDDVDDELVHVAVRSAVAPERMVPVSVDDDDVQALDASPSSLALAEGGTALLTVRLAFRPSAPVVVQLASSDAPAASVSPSSVTIDASNWQSPPSVVVTAEPDLDTRDEQLALSLTSPGLGSLTIPVAVDDDDVQAIVVDTAVLGLVEGGGPAQVGVRLAFAPDGPVSIAVASSDPGAVSVSPGVLSFDPTGWSVPQLLSVVAVADADPVPEQATLTLSAGPIAPASIAVQVTDATPVVAVYTAPGPAQVFGGALDPATEVEAIRIEVTAPTQLRVESFAPSAALGTCGSDTLVLLYDAQGVERARDDFDGPGSCSRLEPGDDAMRLAPGTWWLTIEEDGRNATVPAWELRLEGLVGDVCGNGYLEPGEGCDDGNLIPGDGCTASCGFEGIDELEPNAVAAQAQLLPARQVVRAGLATPTDVDVFAVDVPAGAHLAVQLGVGGFVTCTEDPELRLELLGTDGSTVLVSNAWSGAFGHCGRIDPSLHSAARAMAAGRYYVRVTETGQDTAAPLYFLHVAVLAPGCGNGVREGSEQCDDGNTVGGDGCSASCGFEPVATHVLPGAAQTVAGSIARAGERDLIRLEVTSTAVLRAESFVPRAAADRCDGADTYLRLYQADGITSLGVDDDGGVGLCSLIDPGVDAFARLSPGTYWLAVEEFGNDAPIPAYELVLESSAPAVCGDGSVNTIAGEQCDDGGVAAGDGCSASCRHEIAATLYPPGGTRTLTIPAGGYAMLRVPLTSGGASIAVTADDGAGSCGTDSDLDLYDERFVRLGGDILDGPGACAAIRPPTDAWATDLPERSHHVRVRNAGTTSGPITVAVTVTPAACGDGLVSWDGGESCEDGNTTPGDGCSAQCTTEGARVETEPNDSIATADDSGLAGPGSRLAIGRIDYAGDHDYFDFVVPPGPARPVTLRTYGRLGAPTSSCNGDTVLDLYDASGTSLATNDDGGFDLCSLLTSPPLEAGRYAVRVRRYADAGPIEGYFLDLVLP